MVMKRKIIIVSVIAAVCSGMFFTSCKKDNRDTTCTCYYDDGYYTDRFVVDLEYEGCYEEGIYTCEELSYYMGPEFYCE